MADNSNIEWTDATWTIVQGCDPYSQGCVGCYAVPLLWRMAHNPDPKISAPLQGLVEKHINRAGVTILRFTGKLALREDRLSWPLDWKTPRMIFVPSHGDIFHKDVPDEFLDRIFDVMERATWHTFQVLTKRSRRMREYVNRRYADRDAPAHIWFMVSAEDQPNAVERIPDLLATKAAVRGVSLEPLIGPIDIAEWLTSYEGCGNCGDGSFYEGARRCCDEPVDVECVGLDWVIVGGESGKLARPMHPAWARSLRDQCAAAGKLDSFFFKQWGEWLPGEANRGQFDPRPMHAYRRCDDHSYEWPAGNHRVENFGSHPDRFSGDWHARRVGKEKSGRLLDGVEHNGMPEARV